MLEGIRVIDMGTVITAPLTGMMLGDLGAEVIKVERPEGDPFRRSHGDTYGPNYVAYNRNKRSIVLDLTKAEDRSALDALIGGADVLIDNFRTAALGKLGLDPERLRARNPRLVHCSITGFGASGPYAERPAFDAVGQALSGISSLFVDPEEPQSFGPTLTDNVTGMYAAYGILAALVERSRTGAGRRLEINMLEASMAFIQDQFTGFTRSGVLPQRFTRVATSQSFAFRCADGKLIGIHLSTRDKFWQELLKALGADDLAADERFGEHLQRVKQYQEVRKLLAARFLTRSRAEWVARLEQVDVPFAPICTLPEAMEDAQVEALGTVWRGHHPQEGDVVGIHCPILVDGERPTKSASPPPGLGEHTAQILAEIARGEWKPA